MTAIADRRLSVWQGKVNANVRVAGSGSPVVFLHGAGGLVWDGYLEMLAARHTVYAPEHPGTTAGDPDAISQIDTLWDLIVYYNELLDALGLKSVPIIGHSFGAMLAAEIAANNPERVSSLVLLCPIGLWKDELPIPNWMLVTPAGDMPKLLFYEPDGPLAQMAFGNVDVEAQIRMVWSMACTGKFVWPIPDKGLKKRIHRIHAPTLIVWGNQDRLVPPAYAQEFAGRIRGSKVEMIDKAGHLLTLEHPGRVAEFTEEFIEASLAAIRLPHR